LAEQTTKRQVSRINLRTYGWATRYVYGYSPELLIQLHEHAVGHPELVAAPSKQRIVLMEDLDTADPEAAERNAAQGWDRYITKREEDGSFRLLSYEVIDTIDDARRAIAPRRMRAHGDEVHWPSELGNENPDALE
jgi:hypothetical protein